MESSQQKETATQQNIDELNEVSFEMQTLEKIQDQSSDMYNLAIRYIKVLAENAPEIESYQKQREWL